MIRIRGMTAADIPLGMRLREEAGWNQTRDDWRRFLSLAPHGCFVAELGESAVGTVTTCIFDDVGWIGMMLVEERARGRGVGTKMMEAALDYLTGHGVRSIRLDATPMGQPLYEGLGFVGQFRLQRFAGVVGELNSADRVRSLERHDWEQTLLLDKAVVGYDRQQLLERLFLEASQSAFFESGDGVNSGYGLTRRGSLATSIGPCIATCTTAGRRVLSHLLDSFAGREVFVDVPRTNRAAQEVLRNAGLEPSRELLRMCRGHQVTERVDCLWASSGPEKG